MKFIHYLLVLFGILLLAGCAPAPVLPASAAAVPVASISDDQVNAVAHQLYCPICKNISLDVCPTTACANWRELIRQKLAAGWSTQQIKDYFATQYGSQVLPEPPLQGFNWLAYVLPLLGLVALLVTGWSVARRLQKRSAAAFLPSSPESSLSAPAQDDYVARLEEELRRRSKKE